MTSAQRSSGQEGRERERGAAALATVVAFGMFMMVLTLFIQFAVWQYGRGVLRSAALEAARAQAPLGAPDGACLARFASVRDELLGGTLGGEVGDATCVVNDDTVTVMVDASFERWLPISPDWSFTVTAVAVREREPV